MENGKNKYRCWEEIREKVTKIVSKIFNILSVIPYSSKLHERLKKISACLRKDLQDESESDVEKINKEIQEILKTGSKAEGGVLDQKEIERIQSKIQNFLGKEGILHQAIQNKRWSGIKELLSMMVKVFNDSRKQSNAKLGINTLTLLNRLVEVIASECKQDERKETLKLYYQVYQELERQMFKNCFSECGENFATVWERAIPYEEMKRSAEGKELCEMIDNTDTLELIENLRCDVITRTWYAQDKDIKSGPKNSLVYYYGEEESFSVPEGVEMIGENAFSGNGDTNKGGENLKMLYLPESITRLDKSALSGCKNVEFVHLPSNLKDLDDCALFGCKKLSTLILPESLQKIGENMFCSVKHIVFFRCTKENKIIESGIWLQAKQALNDTNILVPIEVDSNSYCISI